MRRCLPVGDDGADVAFGKGAKEISRQAKQRNTSSRPFENGWPEMGLGRFIQPAAANIRSLTGGWMDRCVDAMVCLWMWSGVHEMDPEMNEIVEH